MTIYNIQTLLCQSQNRPQFYLQLLVGWLMSYSCYLSCIASDGRITTNAILDYETIPQYIFTVTTQEGENGGVSSTATVTVNVLVSR
jgi:hypothetical protein